LLTIEAIACSKLITANDVGEAVILITVQTEQGELRVEITIYVIGEAG